jgi:shikimate kinase
VTPRRVYLTGFMGSGKTSVGALLAERLGVPFVDLDLAFEAMAGRTIRETFATHGEAWFRARESELLAGTADLPRAVVALGGGTFVLPENAAFVKKHGVSVFLDVPFEVIAARLRGKADRPLFRSADEARALYEARQPYYRIADWIVSVREGEAVSDVVERIEEVLSASPSPDRAGR